MKRFQKLFRNGLCNGFSLYLFLSLFLCLHL